LIYIRQRASHPQRHLDLRGSQFRAHVTGANKLTLQAKV
jgi:hypothetical protein